MKQLAPQPKQLSFASYEYPQKKPATRHEKFLAELGQVVQWACLEALIETKYLTGRRLGRQPHQRAAHAVDALPAALVRPG
jgi:IS5 family transposase